MIPQSRLELDTIQFNLINYLFTVKTNNNNIYQAWLLQQEVTIPLRVCLLYHNGKRLNRDSTVVSIHIEALVLCTIELIDTGAMHFS